MIFQNIMKHIHLISFLFFTLNPQEDINKHTTILVNKEFQTIILVLKIHLI